MDSKKKSIKTTIVVDNSEDDLFSDSDTNDKPKSNVSDEDSEFTKKCEELIDKITKNYKEEREEIRNLVKLHKKELKNSKKKKTNSKKKDKTGFTKPSIVPDNLANFLGLQKGTVISRTELTGLLCKEFNKRNLYHQNDRRIIIPDEEVRKLFNLPKTAEKSSDPKDKNGLNFYNLQKYIANCYNDFNDVNNQNKINTPNDNLFIIQESKNPMKKKAFK